VTIITPMKTLIIVDAGIDNLSMLFLGLLGAGHCLGMCGPIVVALPGQFERWHAHVLYHCGRIMTYTVLGGVLGGIGQGLIHLAGLGPDAGLVWISRLQIAMSLVAVVFLTLFGLSRLRILEEPAWMAKATPHKMPGFGTAMKNTLNRGSALWLFAMGLLLGLLPCGLSYAAFARALAAGSLVQGALMTALFGLGTLPGLLLLGTGAAKLLRRYREQTEILAGLVMIGMAISLTAKAWTTYF
jgi:uncharacterized protein